MKRECITGENEIKDYHNTLRSSVSPPAADMVQIVSAEWKKREKEYLW